PLERLDAIYFSPHKFLGGPGSSGVLIFKAELYKNRVPDNPGGGTVNWTNPWGEHSYIEEIEAREDGGTPSFLQTMRAALSIQLKEKMGVKQILEREHEQLAILWNRMKAIKGLHLLADNHPDRLGVISFYYEDIHYNLAVKILNDRFGIQTRGGCSCAGTYGHYLLEVSYQKSRKIVNRISHGDYSQKPGWVRLSIHPTMSNDEIIYIAEALEALAENYKEWSTDYVYDLHKNEFYHRLKPSLEADLVDEWFDGVSF
ncbi:MAG TPA: aminotransferase class V-fold PLP-dependent enzyme, partial [Saprospiraceae bacterium]|nr:aminotransferase class V-fold PLP-dependent enzyme [Saprospiraceae bacterium]